MDKRTYHQLLHAAQGDPAVPPTTLHSIRPLQGLKPNQMGQSVTLNDGDSRAVFEARTEADEAEVLTVTVSKQLQSGSTTFPGNPIITGHVLWGMGGSTFESDIDIVNGMTFSVCANYFRLSASYTHDPGDAGPFPPVQVFGGIGYGRFQQKTSSPRLTVSLGGIAAGGSVSTIVPPFATSFTVASTNTPPNLLIDIDDGLGFIQNRFVYNNNTNAARHTEDQFPLSNRAYRIFVSNQGPVLDFPVVLIFNLSF